MKARRRGHYDRVRAAAGRRAAQYSLDHRRKAGGVNETTTSAPVVIALDIADLAFAARLAMLLSDVPGLHLTSEGERAVPETLRIS
jgi:hypothetical protein